MGCAASAGAQATYLSDGDAPEARVYPAERCAICLETFEETSEPTRVLVCGPMFFIIHVRS